ncbi:hypothetical protein FDI69_gp092 [Rhodococcus phage Trina]|uniref:Holin n=1 Tax=Rhodococcus phage Trina TaxID=2027905 RepID=A0A2D1A431_9CAUD|nr:hypothetical protein FDI69_gp092 [Rhodococcus phage Trina]ASZ74906.1 hypothetical protein SEA_TRINA_92 [Rhodococcus phage Trina]
MAFTVKGKSYNVANIRKSIVAFLGTLITFIGSFALLVNDVLPAEWVAGVGIAGAVLTGVVAFLIKNAALIDGIDGVDPEDTPLF